jgi:hypothetical protein
MRQEILSFLGNLLEVEPDVAATIENSGKSVWVTLKVPAWDDGLEIEFRGADSIGLYLPPRSPDDDVPYRGPDQHYADFAKLGARIFQLLNQARVA